MINTVDLTIKDAVKTRILDQIKFFLTICVIIHKSCGKIKETSRKSMQELTKRYCTIEDCKHLMNS